MAIKPFEIQSPSIVLAGVQMQAGATGVVIPGVTQATTYSVEEVDNNGNQSVTWSSVPTVIDNGRYSILNGDPEPAGYVASAYTVEELNDANYIDEIQVDTAGSFPASFESFVAQNMWATTVADPFTSFNPSDWTQIPFRPQIRAGEVENISGSGTQLGFGYTIGNNLVSGEFTTSSSTPSEVTNISINPTDSGNINLDTLMTYMNSKDVIVTISNTSEQASFNVNNIQPYVSSYNGYKAVYTKLWDDDPGFSKIAFYKDTATVTTTVPGDTNNDQFEIAISSGSSDLLGLAIIYTENSNFIPTNADLTEYFQNFVDNILVPSSGNVTAIRSNFYNNIANSTALITSWGETPYNLDFYTNGTDSIYTGRTGNGGSGSGCTADIVPAGDGSYRIVSFNGGVDYQVGDTVVFSGNDLGGSSPNNDYSLVVATVNGGGQILTYSDVGDNAGTWPTDYISDGGSDQYDDGNYLQTNQQATVPYSNGTVQNTGAFYTNEWFVGYAYGQFIFFGDNTNGYVGNFGTYGETGSDGDGLRETGDLSSVLYYDLSVNTVLDYTPDMDLSEGSYTINFDVAGLDTNGVVFSQTQTNTITTDSGDLYLKAADDVRIQSTDYVEVRGGNKLPGQNSTGGWVNVSAGQGSEARTTVGNENNAGAGGTVEIYGGDAGGDGGNTSLGAQGGSINIVGGGSSGNNNGGEVRLTGGNGSGTGHKGSIVLDLDQDTTFVYDGTIIFPTLATDLHNGGVQNAQTLKFGDPNQQVIITGPTPPVDNAAQRLIIQGQAGNGTGEGGDVYLWAGDAQTNGGDIKIYAGDADASGSGGYINIDAGSGVDGGGQVNLTGGSSSNGSGGPIYVTAGYSGGADGSAININGGQSAANAGPVNVTGGYGAAKGGNVVITGGGSGLGLPGYGNVYVVAGTSTWTFDNTGTLTVPGEGIIKSINDTVTLRTFNTTTGNANSVYLGTSGGLGFEDQEIGGNWLEIFRSGSDPLISVPSGGGNLLLTSAAGTSGAGGKNVTITAGAADQSDFYTTPGGDINIAGGLGAFNDGGGGGPGGNVNLTAGNSSDPAGHAGNVNISAGSNDWVFSYTGTAWLPGGTSSISGSANNILIWSDLAQTNGVSLYDGGVDIYGTNDVAIYADNGNLTWTFDNSGTLLAPGAISATGNITAANLGNISSINLNGNASQVLYGNGEFATAGAGSSYSDSNVTTLLAAYGSNTISTTGTVNAGNVTGGNILTGGLISSTGNITSAANITAGNIVANSYVYSGTGVYRGGVGAVQIELSSGGVLWGGNLTLNSAVGYIKGSGGSTILAMYANADARTYGGNLFVGVSSTGNIIGGNLTLLGTTTTGVNSILAGPTFTPLGNTATGFVANVNNYTQVTFQNKNTGTDATADYILTADNGSDSVNYSDFGIINSGYDNATPTNSLGNIVFAADTYLYAQGNVSNTSQSGGNLVIGTTVAGKNVKIFAGGNTASALVANISNTGVAITGALDVTGTSSNVIRRAFGLVAADTYVQLDDIKARVTSSTNQLSLILASGSWQGTGWTETFTSGSISVSSWVNLPLSSGFDSASGAMNSQGNGCRCVISDQTPSATVYEITAVRSGTSGALWNISIERLV